MKNINFKGLSINLNHSSFDYIRNEIINAENNIERRIILNNEGIIKNYDYNYKIYDYNEESNLMQIIYYNDKLSNDMIDLILDEFREIANVEYEDEYDIIDYDDNVFIFDCPKTENEFLKNHLIISEIEDMMIDQDYQDGYGDLEDEFKNYPHAIFNHKILDDKVIVFTNNIEIVESIKEREKYLNELCYYEI